MWLFTRHGMYSVVCARKKNRAIDADRLLVRSRIKGHLENLKKVFELELSGAKILTNAGTDYPFRIVVEKTIWTQIALQLMDDINYANFKSEVGHEFGEANRYTQALHRIWEVMRQAGEAEARTPRRVTPLHG